MAATEYVLDEVYLTRDDRVNAQLDPAGYTWFELHVFPQPTADAGYIEYSYNEGWDEDPSRAEPRKILFLSQEKLLAEWNRILTELPHGVHMHRAHCVDCMVENLEYAADSLGDGAAIKLFPGQTVLRVSVGTTQARG